MPTRLPWIVRGAKLASLQTKKLCREYLGKIPTWAKAWKELYYDSPPPVSESESSPEEEPEAEEESVSEEEYSVSVDNALNSDDVWQGLDEPRPELPPLTSSTGTESTRQEESKAEEESVSEEEYSISVDNALNSDDVWQGLDEPRLELSPLTSSTGTEPTRREESAVRILTLMSFKDNFMESDSLPSNAETGIIASITEESSNLRRGFVGTTRGESFIRRRVAKLRL